MPGFRFQTIDATGRRTHGATDAVNAAALTRDLEAQGLTVLDVRADADGADRTSQVPRRDVADAARALASLLDAGLPLARALDVAASAAPSPFAAVLRDVQARIERGEHMAGAMAAHPEAFSAMAIGVVRAGERAGDLDGAFAQLAGQLEREEDLSARLISAAIYPVILAVAGGAAIVVLLVFVLPRFTSLFEGTGLPLPRSTAWLLAAATALRANWIVLPVVAGVTLAVAAWVRATERGQRMLAGAMLALPVLGGFRRDVLAASCARTLGVLLRGGSTLPVALDDAAASVTDPLLRDALARVRTRVLAGSTLRAAMDGEPAFHRILLSLVATGEEAGRLADFLARAAALFEQRAERGAQRLVALLEPAMIIAFGGVVALVALSLLQAIYGLNPAGLR
jgi:type II secretory pathway component PulF